MNIRTALLDLFASYRTGRARRFGLEVAVTIAVLGVVILVSSNLNGLPDMQAIEDISERKATFFNYLSPIAETLNRDILERRAWLLEVSEKYQRDQDLSFLDEYKLKSLAQDYALEWDASDPAAIIAALRLRVDLVPISLVLVQAAKESGWGTSRFAREGNNLFGQWCYSEGCGIVPANRASGAKHEVREFDSIKDAISAYLHNINTGKAYASLRKIRADQRKAGKNPDGKALADGLLHYSQRREAYVQEVKVMLDQYHRFQQQQSG